MIRPGAIGDCLLALPAMEALRTDYTAVWTASQNVPLIRFADRARSIASTGLDMLGVATHELCELAGFDSIVSWYGTNRPEFRAAVEGLPFRFLPALPDAGSKIHAADFFLRQAGGGAEPAIPRLDCPRIRGEYLAVHPFSGGARKNWPLDRFRELALRLGGPVRWYAGPDDPPLPEAERCDELYELACRLAGARLYIGNDSGITHLAAAAGAPVLALFGPTDPAVWAPRGERVRVLATPHPGEPIENLSIEEALAAAEDIPGAAV